MQAILLERLLMKKNNDSIWFQTFIPSLTLFTSFGTLVCCALPALMVALGMGTTLAGFISMFPSITLISNYKESIFIISGILIILGFFFQIRSRNISCPTDQFKADLCNKLRKISWIMLIFSLVIYVVGFFFAFLAISVFY